MNIKDYSQMSDAEKDVWREEREEQRNREVWGDD